MKQINNDLQDYLTQSNLDGMAESHLSCWIERYKGMGKQAVADDLGLNHDDCLEIEDTEEVLQRKLNDEEIEYLIDKFHDAIINNINFLNGGGANGYWDTCGDLCKQ